MKENDTYSFFPPEAHVQYLETVIKKGKQRMKRKYGVQYVLDTIRTFYG